MIELIVQTIIKIDDLIKEKLPESKYQFELYDLTTNTKHFRGHDELFHWGSIYKLFMVAEIIKMSEEGFFKMDDEIDLPKDVYVNGNGIVKYLTHLNRLTYTDTCKMVMAASDNLCADGLLAIAGLPRLNKLFEKANAQNSLLSINLDTMVKEVFESIQNSIGVQYYHSQDFFSHFKQSLAELLKKNHTNAKDINNCFHFIMNDYLSNAGNSLLKEFVLTPNVHTRMAMYTPFGRYLLRGKTGALGAGSVNSEVVGIFEKESKEIKGYFSLLLKDNKDRYFITNDVLGLAGIEIVQLYEELYSTDQ